MFHISNPPSATGEGEVIDPNRHTTVSAGTGGEHCLADSTVARTPKLDSARSYSNQLLELSRPKVRLDQPTSNILSRTRSSGTLIPRPGVSGTVTSTPSIAMSSAKRSARNCGPFSSGGRSNSSVE